MKPMLILIGVKEGYEPNEFITEVIEQNPNLNWDLETRCLLKWNLSRKNHVKSKKRKLGAASI